MHRITLNNGMQMPVIGFGTFQMTGKVCEDAVCEAIRAGYRLIDTAQAYGNEEAVGAGIKKSGIAREELFIVTKVNFPSYEQAEAVVKASLEKLQTAYLDLVLLHWPFGNYYQAWRVLERFYEEGTIRSIGVSNFEPDRIIDLVHFNKVVPVVDQIETHLFCQRQTERTWMDKYQVAHMAYAPLGQGQKNEMFSQPEVLSLAESYGKTPAQILLRFLTQKDIIVIPKSSHENRIRENLDIFDITLTDEEMARLTALDTGKAFGGNPEQPEMIEAAMHW